MTEIWALAALWLGLALIATLLSIWLRIATAVVPTLIANAGFLPRHLIPRELVAPLPAAGESGDPAPTGTAAPISAPSSQGG